MSKLDKEKTVPFLENLITLCMKALLLIIAFVPFYFFGQDVIYKSDRLDSLVWEKINDRLVSLGKKPIPIFDHSEVKNFSERVCERMLPTDAPQVHSSQDSIKVYSGCECIYSCKIQSTTILESEFLPHLLNGNLDPIAQNIIDGWVGSEDHNRVISSDLWSTSTVSVMIHYNVDKGYYKLVANWQETDWLSKSR